MEFENRLKRELSQGVLKCLLEDCGYRVVPLGIEAVIREISCLDKQSYLQLNFTNAVKFLPDYCVLDKEQKQKYIVEVKYRSKWNTDILKEVSEQVKIFEDIIMVIFIGNPPISNFSKRPSNYIRCCRLYVNKNGENAVDIKEKNNGNGDTISVSVNSKELSKIKWWDLPILQKYFTNLKKTKQDSSLMKAIHAINGILGDNQEKEEAKECSKK